MRQAEALRLGSAASESQENRTLCLKKRTSLLKKSLQSLRENLSLLVHSMAEGINKQKVDKE
jgi:hypothetical protein